MNYGFWKQLKKPILVLAPMANVTDAAFRRVIAKYGKPDVTWTEFVSCDGLCSAGKEKLLKDLWFDESERPIVAQIFGAKPENFYKTALLLQELGFDGIDINMGCPDKNVMKQGAGAALIKNPKLAQEIILATKKGAGKLPVSVKTRIGYDKDTLEEWLPYLLEVEPAVITIHGRTKKEMSLVPAHWDRIGDAARITREYFGDKERPLILGNGDIQTLEEADAKIQQYNLDGAMVGRGIFGNPWFFNREKKEITSREKLQALLEHLQLFKTLFSDSKHFDVMKKHFKAYINGFDGAKELRTQMQESKDPDEIEKILTDYIAQHP